MARTLRGLGFLLVAAAVWIALAGAAGWLEQDTADGLAPVIGSAAVLALGSGILLGFLGKVTRPILQARCETCGARIDRGKTYCMDHLLATVIHARERPTERLPAREAPRRK